MIKILKYSGIMQNDVKDFIMNNISSELCFKDQDSFEKITNDLDNIKNNYIENRWRSIICI